MGSPPDACTAESQSRQPGHKARTRRGGTRRTKLEEACGRFMTLHSSREPSAGRANAPAKSGPWHVETQAFKTHQETHHRSSKKRQENSLHKHPSKPKTKKLGIAPLVSLDPRKPRRRLTCCGKVGPPQYGFPSFLTRAGLFDGTAGPATPWTQKEAAATPANMIRGTQSLATREAPGSRSSSPHVFP